MFPSTQFHRERLVQQLLWWCYVLFAFSFVFDYRAPDIGFAEGKTGGSPVQYLMLLVALASGFASAVIGWRLLLVRPGVWLILIWFGYLGFSLFSSLANGVPPSMVLRLMVAPILVGLGIVTAHCALVSGATPAKVVKVFLVVCVVNMVWQTMFSYVTSGNAATETRPEVSPGVRFAFAWMAACVFLSNRVKPSALMMGGLAVLICVLCMTRSSIMYLFVALFAGGLFVLWGMMLRRFNGLHLVRRSTAMIGVVVLASVIIFLVVYSVPALRDWWIERLFYSDGGGSTSEDMSMLTRKAEAEAMFSILNENKFSWVWGKGYGATYHWNDDYLPELYLTYRKLEEYPSEITSAGHSLWTYSVFASGIFGVIAWLLLFSIPAFAALVASYKQSRLADWKDDFHYVGLGFICSVTMISATILENPFDNRITGPLTGIAAALPLYYITQAYLLQRSRNREVDNQWQLQYERAS